MSAIGPILSIVGSGVSAYGQIAQGQAREGAYEYNADIARQKAKFEAEETRKKYERVMGQQRALYAKAGVSLESGSPLLMMAFTAGERDREIELIKWGGETEAGQQEMYGRYARHAGITGGLSTFITGLGQAGMQYYKGRAGAGFEVNPSYL